MNLMNDQCKKFKIILSKVILKFPTDLGYKHIGLGAFSTRIFSFLILYMLRYRISYEYSNRKLLQDKFEIQNSNVYLISTSSL